MHIYINKQAPTKMQACNNKHTNTKSQEQSQMYNQTHLHASRNIYQHAHINTHMNIHTSTFTLFGNAPYCNLNLVRRSDFRIGIWVIIPM